MHAVELKHQHPGQIAGQSHSQTNPFGELSEYMHGTNKKHFIVELTVFLFGGAFIGLQGSTWLEIVTAACVTALCSFRKKRSLMLRYFNLYQHLFSSGLLNPRSHFSLL